MPLKYMIVIPSLLLIVLGLSARGGGASLLSLHGRRLGVPGAGLARTEALQPSLRSVHPSNVSTSAHGITAEGSIQGSSDAKGGVALPLSVDGAQNPERIPDYLAYRHFISVTAVRTVASAEEISRRDAFLAQVGLSAADRASYLSAIKSVQDELSVIDHRAKQPGSVSDPRLQLGRALDDAAARVASSLTREGVQRMRQHINEHVKKHIKIYSLVQ